MGTRARPRPLTLTPELASGNRISHVPFSTLVKRPTDFIEGKYIPDGVVVKDPHNMWRDHIRDWCDHIRKRQREDGVHNAFKFHRYLDGKDMKGAEYGRRADKEKAATRAATRTAQQRERRAAVAQEKRANHQAGRAGQVSRVEAGPPGAGAINNAAEDRADAVPGTVDYANIDPALRPMAATQLAPPVDGIPSLRPIPATPLTPPMHGIPSPRRTPEESDNYIVVSFVEMGILRQHGYKDVPALNGPSQGNPTYSVPASARQLLDSLIEFSPPAGILPTSSRPSASETDVLPSAINPATASQTDPGRRRSQRNRGPGLAQDKSKPTGSSRGVRGTRKRG